MDHHRRNSSTASTASSTTTVTTTTYGASPPPTGGSSAKSSATRRLAHHQKTNSNGQTAGGNLIISAGVPVAAAVASSSSAVTGATSPSRAPSPGLGLILDRESYWTVTLENGCVPSLTFALEINRDTAEPIWWGGRFEGPLGQMEDLVDDLPQVLKDYKIEERVMALPEIELFASPQQKMNIELDRAKYTGQGHRFECPSASYGTRAIVVLQSDVARERAFAMFAFLANAFVFFQSTVKHPNGLSGPVVLPARIASPLTRLSSALGRLPITDYACSVLNNWTLIDPKKPLSLDNVYVPRTFTGLEAERWFFAIHVMIEHHGGKALVNMYQAKEHISKFLMLRKLRGLGEGANKRAVALQRLLGHSKQFSVATASSSLPTSPTTNSTSSAAGSEFVDAALETCAHVQHHLEQLSTSLESIGETMKHLPDNCPAEVFFDEIRQWLSSWPDPGVIYDTYCTCKDKSRLEPCKYSGASGAQSSLLPSIDGFLGIAYGHRQNVEATPEVARTDLGAFIRQLKGFRQSMPPAHRDLVSRFESQGDVKELIAALDELVLRTPSSDKFMEESLSKLKAQYNNCIELLTLFRRTHMDYAVKYIKSMAGRRQDQAATTAASTSAVRGTGGSDFAKHLAQHITDTRKSLYDVGTHTPTTTPNLNLLGGGVAGSATPVTATGAPMKVSPGLHLGAQPSTPSSSIEVSHRINLNSTTKSSGKQVSE